MNILHLPLGLAVIGVLSACGGGGSSAPAPAQVNRAPSSIALSSSSVLEGISGASVGTLSTSDPDGGAFNYSISGDDADSFSVSGSSLSLGTTVAADYETQTSYSISIRSTDSGGLSITEDFALSVIDAIEGRVVDAPLSGSQVFIDLNGNLVKDSDEPDSSSDQNGFFAVENLVGEGSPKIISVGGTDTKTGEELPNLALMSDLPSDASKTMSVTPITTVVAAAETPAAKEKVLEALGVQGTVEELLTTDNWAAAEAGDESAKDLQRKNQQIGLILQTAETLVESNSSTKAADITQAVAKKLVEETSANASVDLTQTTTIAELLTDVVAKVAPENEVEATTIAAISNSVSEVNTLVADSALDPTGDVSAEILGAAQTTLQASVEDLTDGTVDVASFETATESKNLFEGSTVLEALPDFDEDGLADAVDLDDDADGVLDPLDAFPLDSGETLDTDGDGTGNNTDTDDDGDGALDTADAFPLDKSESLDTDGDGIGNNGDTDDDGDGVLDITDLFPLVSLGGLLDTDKDGAPNDCGAECLALGMTADSDDDADGVADASDGFPLIAIGSLTDTDKDGRPDECAAACLESGMTADTDDDGDSVLDASDAYPLVALGSLTDTDQDGRPNDCDEACQANGMAADADDDNDNASDSIDLFPLNSKEFADFDKDGIGDVADTDDDNDGTLDSVDSSIYDAFPSEDALSVPLDISKVSLPGELIRISPVTQADPNLYLNEGNQLEVFSAGGSFSRKNNQYNQGESGSWLIANNRVEVRGIALDSDTTQGVSKITIDRDWLFSSNSYDLGWTNVDKKKWRTAVTLEDREVQIKKINDEDWHLIENKDGRWVFGVTALTTTYLLDSALQSVLVDATLPVKTDTTYERRTFFDSSAALSLTADEIVGSWAMSLDVDNTRKSDAAGEVPIFADIATFKADGTGSTRIRSRSFTWSASSIAESGVSIINVEFVDNGAKVSLTKYQKYDDYLIVQSNGLHDGKTVHKLDFAFRVSEGELDLSALMGRDLITSSSQPFSANPEKPWNYSTSFAPSPLYFGYRFNDDATMKQLRSFSPQGFPMERSCPFQLAIPPKSETDSDKWKAQLPENNEGWKVLNYSWTRTVNEFNTRGCFYLPDGNCATTYERDITVLGVSGSRMYYLLDAYTHTGGDVDKLKSEMDIFTNYLGFLEVFDASDIDKDGVKNLSDALPWTSTESVDSDGDGVGDNTDAFPQVCGETIDTDQDGIGNLADTDDDGDSVLDTADAFPLDATRSLDGDADGVDDKADLDDNSDGLVDLDLDGDLTGDEVDTDKDGDGVLNIVDAFPADKSETLDTDGDGIGNNADTDDDGDTVADASDSFPLDASESVDTDGDGVGDNSDILPLDVAESKDFDGDGVGDNADTDDDNDGTPDASDDTPFDAFPLDDTISIAKVLDASQLPKALVNVVEFKEADPDFSENLSNAVLLLDSSGTAQNVGTYFQRNEAGSWRVSDNQLLLEGMTSGISSFPYLGGTLPSDWTNVNTDYFSANNPIQLETTVKVDHAHWLVDYAGGRWVFYTKTTRKTFLKDSNYLVDASLPVNEATTYAQNIFYDKSKSIAFTAEEITGSWGLQMDLDVTKSNSGDANYNSLTMGGTENAYMVGALVNFSADGTGKTETTQRALTWSINENGAVDVVYTDNQTKVTLTKYATYADSIAVHVFAQQGATLASDYTIGVKSSGQPIDLSDFYGKGLTTSKSDKFNPLLDPSAEGYSPNYFGYRFDSGGTMENYMDFEPALYPGIFYPSGGSTQTAGDVYKVDKGWITRSYTWTQRGNVIEAKACFRLNSCARKSYRNFFLFRSTSDRIYYLLTSTRDMDHDGSDKPVADRDFWTNYGGFLEVFDFHDIDGDGYENEIDFFPYDPLAQ